MLVINFSKRVKPIWKKKNCINNKRKLRLSYDMSQIGQIWLTNIARQRAFLPKTQSGGVTLHKVTQQMNYITKTESLKNITNDLGIAYLLTSGINMCSACLSHIFSIWIKGIEEEKQYDFDWNGDCCWTPDHHYTRVSLSQLTKSSWAGFTLQECYNSQSGNIKAMALIFEDKKTSCRRVIVRELH